jgi:hypothetical protein
MASYFFSFLWGIIILLSLTGWGSVTRRCFFPKSQTDWGQKAAWGIALSILVGGVLNIAGLISRTTVLVYLGGGFLYRLFDIFSGRDTNMGLLREYIRDWRRDKVVMVGIFAIFFLAIVQYGGWVSTQDFNSHDDFHAYFIFPKKMLQTGSMGPDPFCERRIESSLGGQAFLQTFVLSVLSERNFNVIDQGVGVLIVIGLLLGYFKRENTPKRTAVFVLILFLITPPPKVNITSLVVPIALFISFFRTLEWEELEGGRFITNAFVIALLATAICSLKSSLIPACGVLLVTSYIFYIARARIKREAVYEFFVAVILTGAFLLPWMISMYQSSGTLLYPLLGKGYHGSAYGTFLDYTGGMTTERTIHILTYHFSRPYVILLVWLSFVVLRLRSTRSGWRGAYISVSTGAILGMIIILIATGGAGNRYYFSFTFAAALIFLAAVLSGPETRKDGSMGIYAYAAMSLAFITIGYNWDSFLDQYVRFIRDVRKGVSNVSLISDKEAAQYSRMQLSVPAGETILERLSKPFLLDFRRNRIFIADYPGGASLPPGMPFFKGPEMLADYLISKSIRYVAYSYASEAGFRWKDYADRLDSISSLIATEAEHAFDFQNNLEQLGKTRKRIYDDGDIFVLDLLNYSNQQQDK